MTAVAKKASNSNTLSDIIGTDFLNKEGNKVTFSSHIAGNKLIGLFFSAHWCGPCRAFVPKLKACHEKWVNAKEKIVIVFGSSDKSEEKFNDFFAEMGDWLAFPFEDSRIKTLKKKYEVNGIPWLVILDEYGNLIHNEADTVVGSKKEVAIEDWKSKIQSK